MSPSTDLDESVPEAAARPIVILVIAVAIALTTLRFLVFREIPTLQRFDGVEDNSWLAPWVADTILGATAPLMAYLAWNKTGPKLWGALIAYNAIGAFDYAHGMATWWAHPQIDTGMTAGSFYPGLALAFTVQTSVLISLFRSRVATHYLNPSFAGARASQSRTSAP